MKQFTDKEIKEMIGTEFIYVLGDKDEVPAVIAAYDPEVGFTCLATSIESKDGYDFSDELDENGNLCLIGVHFDRETAQSFNEKISSKLRCITALGYYRADYGHGFGYKRNLSGNTYCAF